MKYILKNIKDFVFQWKQNIKEKIQNSPKEIKLAIVQVGDNEASNRYVKNKIKDCEEVGIIATLYKYDEHISNEKFQEELKKICSWDNGVIVQLPLPPQIKFNKNMIPKNKDIDGFRDDSNFIPCTPLGIIKYLEYCNFDVDGKNVLIIGRSEIVGKPLAKNLSNLGATVTLAHSRTKNLWDFIPRADLIICAVGIPHFLNCYDIYCPIIDVGINFLNGRLVGDCYETEDRDVTPVPGGVGLLTRAAVLENCWKRKEYLENE